MDRLAPFLARFSLTTSVFFTGHICGTSHDHATKTVGHLHLLRRGTLHIVDRSGKRTTISEPTVVLFLRPQAHTIQSDDADLVCALIDFGAGTLNPLALGLPSYIALPLSSISGLGCTAELLFAEAFGQRDGRQVAVNWLMNYLLVLVLRHALDEESIQGGLLAALSDNNLSKALAAIHEEPEHTWTLEELGHIAGMSRARFAAHFLATTGRTVFDYLAVWRIGLAQSMLKRGEPLKMIAPAVGYASAGALTRSFSHRIGMPPMTWLASQKCEGCGARSRRPSRALNRLTTFLQATPQAT